MRPSPIVARIVIATAFATIGIIVVSAILLGTVRSLQHSNSREIRSRDVTVAALEVQTLVLDLESGLRGYVISGNRRFLRPWSEARRRLPAATARLHRLAADDPAQRARVRVLVARIDEYELDFGVPLLRIVSISRPAARSAVATGESRRRIEDVRSVLRRVLAAEDRRSTRRAADSRSQARRAFAVVLVALALSALFLILFGAYVARAVARPVGRVAAAAQRVAAGDFSVRTDEGGVGEVRDLMRAFNEMTTTLEEGRRELLEQNARLQTSEQHKSELISMVSHELRTPLASVLGFTRLLLQRQFSDEERTRYLQIIDAEAQRLTLLANDFLEVQHVEEGRFELHLEQNDLTQLLREQIELFFGPEVTHTVAVSIPPGPVVADFDPDRLVQVLGNLLSNAIKYSPAGSLVEVDLVQDGDVARVLVRDHGLGIPAEHQSRIFSKFFRGSAPAAGIGGTGLGLAVARELVLAHGGRLDFTSAEGRGSTFRLEIPLSRTGRTSAEPVEEVRRLA